MKDFFEDLGKRLGETAETMTNKAGEAIEIQRLKSQSRSLARGNAVDLMELGKMIYDRYKSGETVEEAAQELCEAIQSREKTMEEYDRKIAKIKGATECRNCGRMVGRDMAYCPYCGEKTDDEKEDGDVFEDESEESYADSVKEKAADMAENAAQKVDEAAKKAGDMAACIPSVPPVVPDKNTYRISSSFGYRSDPFTGTKKRHTGMDFACHVGNHVYATADGVVESVSSGSYGYGKFIVVDHGFGYKTRYAHLSSIGVEEGMTVRRGTLIGLSGNSGRSSGPHLHYEVMYMGRYMNPLNYMDLDRGKDEYAQVTEKALSSRNPA